MTLPESFDTALSQGLEALGVEVDAPGRERLRAWVELLLRWNARVNLTSVTDPLQVAEVHLVDSLALLRTLGDAGDLLDIGSGAGLPGLVLACARPTRRVVCAEAVQKKVAFLKAAAAALDLPVTARAVRAAGAPAEEGLPLSSAVVSRALAEPARWLPLGAAYLAPGGRVFAMLGRGQEDQELRALGLAAGLELEAVDRFLLPRSGAQRAIARFRRGG